MTTGSDHRKAPQEVTSEAVTTPQGRQSHGRLARRRTQEPDLWMLLGAKRARSPGLFPPQNPARFHRRSGRGGSVPHWEQRHFITGTNSRDCDGELVARGGPRGSRHGAFLRHRPHYSASHRWAEKEKGNRVARRRGDPLWTENVPTRWAGSSVREEGNTGAHRGDSTRPA